MDTQDFRKRFDERLEKVRAKTDRVFQFEEVDSPPVLVNSAFYHLFGVAPEKIPAGYYDDPAVMTRFQEACYYEQITSIDDDFVPYLMPWFGTAVLSSALGATVEFAAKADPAVDSRSPAIQNAQDIQALKIPDPEQDGLMPRVLRYIRYMRQHSFLPIGITDNQGPLATANQLVGYDRLAYLMHDEPAAVHQLMEKITESLILWVRAQKKEIGEKENECFGDQQVYIGRNAGVWLSDDDAVLVGPSTYKEFVVAYNARIFREFGGGVLHYCGTANHQIDNFLATEGLVGINDYCLHDLDGLAELKKRIEGRLVLIACDFTPRNFTPYYRDIFERLSPRGLIVDSQFSPVVSLTEEGRYTVEKQREKRSPREVFEAITNL